MQGPVVFNFKQKTVKQAGDPAAEKALREVMAAQRNAVMTGPGTARANPAR